ncbi:hypothetical protein QO058_26110 [Bosea vestrisii]|uniref:hypothetical protein n=1 Tax=Bosea vestrisii TaxID=151416 RepID=UPI0024DF7E9F|nr:hypothetical protein [Bosea vestrisii]WID96168.1 hypothetical protein QO058_26110 [Bosea vestrisii]
MTAESSTKNGYVSLMPALKILATRWRQFQRERLVRLDDRLDQEELSRHMARDIGLNDTGVIHDGRHCDRGP